MATIIGKHNGVQDVTLTDWEYGVKALPGDVAIIDGRIWAVYDNGNRVRGWDVTEQIGNQVLTRELAEQRDYQQTINAFLAGTR